MIQKLLVFFHLEDQFYQVADPLYESDGQKSRW